MRKLIDLYIELQKSLVLYKKRKAKLDKYDPNQKVLKNIIEKLEATCLELALTISATVAYITPSSEDTQRYWSLVHNGGYYIVCDVDQPLYWTGSTQRWTADEKEAHLYKDKVMVRRAYLRQERNKFNGAMDRFDFANAIVLSKPQLRILKGEL